MDVTPRFMYEMIADMDPLELTQILERVRKNVKTPSPNRCRRHGK